MKYYLFKLKCENCGNVAEELFVNIENEKVGETIDVYCEKCNETEQKILNIEEVKRV